MFEVDPKVIDETRYCKHAFKCLEGDFSQCGGVQKKGENLLCKSSPKEFCYYRIELSTNRTICACYTRKEIYLKYGK